MLPDPQSLVILIITVIIYILYIRNNEEHVVAGKSTSNVAGNDRKIRLSEEFDKIKSGSEIHICSHNLNKNS